MYTPTDVAFSVLRKSKERSDYDLNSLLNEDEQRAAARHFAGLSPEKQQLMQKIGESFHNMPPEAKGQLTASAHQLIQRHQGQLPQLLSQSPNESGRVNKAFFLAAIAVVIAVDAFNQSQGAERSLVGNVFTDVGNGVSSMVGGDPNFFGSSNYGDVFEYNNETALINPITGQKHMVEENPSVWNRTWKGALSTVGSVVGPVGAGKAVKEGTKAGVKQVTSRFATGAGMTQRGTGKGISRLGRRGTEKAGQRAFDAAPSVEMQPYAKEGALGRLDRFGRKVQASGQSKIDDALAARQASNTSFMNASKNAPLSSYPYRTLQGFGRTPAGQQVAPYLAGVAGLGAAALLGSGMGGGLGMGGGSGMGGGMGGQQHQQGQFNLQGQQSGGIQGVNNVGTQGVADRDIFRQTQGSNFGGNQQTAKGEIMTFTNREGNEMLLKTLELFEKAECPKCGKNCKCDEEKKADDGDKKKKPAHGMVIVIGSKNSGPGPSTEGKRDSKD